MRRFCFTFLAWLCLGLTPALAVMPDERLSDPQLEARARDLSAKFRCLVCQNQSIDESDAPLAHDLRVLIRERLSQGDSDPQVVDYLVARYGDYVLLKPRLTTSSVLLWFLPFIVLLGGGLFLYLRLKNSRPEADAEAKLSQQEQARLSDLD